MSNENQKGPNGGIEKTGGFSGNVVPSSGTRFDGFSGKIEEGLTGGPSSRLLPPDVVPQRPLPPAASTAPANAPKNPSKGSK